MSTCTLKKVKKKSLATSQNNLQTLEFFAIKFLISTG
jgi:hypothetical protein